jgi:O-antigen ligase/uncharacterized membrane protein YbhN (UPF0104 family)
MLPMSRLHSLLTGIVSALAIVLVVVSIDFGKLAGSFHQITTVPVALAVILLVVNFLLAYFRFEWTLGAVSVTLDRRTAIYAFALGNLASQFLLNIIGQSMTRAIVLQASGVPMSATVTATYLERLIAIATLGVGAVLSALALFGSLGFKLEEGGAYFLSVVLAGSFVLAFAGFRHFAVAIGRDNLKAMLRTAERLVPALLVSLGAHLAMFAAYVVLVRAFAPDIDMAKLAPAIVIVMFAAGLPISWAGWGLREFGAVYVFSAIGLSNELAVVVAVLMGAFSLLIGLAVAGAVVVDAWRRPKVRVASGGAKPGMAGGLVPSDPILSWAIGILAACLIYFQLHVPTGNGDFTINAADPLAITALFFAAVHATTGRFLQLYSRTVVWSTCGIAAVLLLGAAVAWLGPGLSKWAVFNRMLGFPFLIGYAAIPGLVMMVAGERGRTILANTFITAAVVICVVQMLALGFHHFVEPLPFDFFGTMFITNGQLEGYAQNPNAFAFQLLMTIGVLIGWRPPRPERPPPLRSIAGAVVLLATLVLSRSRAGLLCGVGALALAALLYAVPPRVLLARRTLVIALIAGAALGMLGIVWSLHDLPTVTLFSTDWRPDSETSDRLRWRSMMLGWDEWRHHPLLGGGLGTFLLGRAGGSIPLVIHSVPIWFMAEMGLVGLAAYGLFVASLVSRGVAALRGSAPYARSLLLVIAVFVVMSLAHDLFFQRTFWFVAGLLTVDAAAVRSTVCTPAVADSRGSS